MYIIDLHGINLKFMPGTTHPSSANREYSEHDFLKKKKKIPLYSIYCSWIILLRSWEIWCNYRLTPCDGWEVCYSTCLCYFGTGSFVASGAKRSFNQSNIIKVDKLMIILVIDYLTIFFMVNQFVHKMSNISGFQLLLSSNHQSQTQWKVNSYI